jgi:hypothetical protein
MAMMYAIPALSQFNHGWVMLIWMSTLMGLTTLLEVLAVPSVAPRSDALKRQPSGGALSPSRQEQQFVGSCCLPMVRRPQSTNKSQSGPDQRVQTSIQQVEVQPH